MSKVGLAGILVAPLLLFTACGDDNSITLSSARIPETVDWSEWTQQESEGASAMDSTDFEEPEPEESSPIEITISAAGDVTMGNYVGQDYSYSFMESWNKNQDAEYYFQNVYDIFSNDDFTLINLEGPLTRETTGREDKTYCIKGDPDCVRILTAGSIEAVGMANNHCMDYYKAGLEDTAKALDAEGILYAYDSNTGVYEVKGIKVGYVALNIIAYGAAVEKQLAEGISSLTEQDVDLILVSCHWGIERENYPDEYQQRLGRKCIDLGADLVLGHHPHVIQGVENYQGKYIVYSMGNFCFGANRNPADKDCIIFQQTFSFEEGGKIRKAQARIIPCSISSVPTRNDYKPTPAIDEEFTRILNRMRTYSQPFGIEFDEDGCIKQGQE